jgi:hypothetical protein
MCPKQAKGRRNAPPPKEAKNHSSLDEVGSAAVVSGTKSEKGESSCDSDNQTSWKDGRTSKRPPPEAPSQRRPKKQRKIKNQDGKPVRPLSAYNAFFREERVKWLAEQTKREQTPDAVAGDEKKSKFLVMGKEIGARWRELSPEQREKYIDIAAEDMKRYRGEMEEYNDKMIRDTVIGRKALEGRTIMVRLGKTPAVHQGGQDSQQQYQASSTEPKLVPTGNPTEMRESTTRATPPQEASRNNLATSFNEDSSANLPLLEQILRITQNTGNPLPYVSAEPHARAPTLNELQGSLLQQLLQAQLLGQQRQQPQTPASSLSGLQGPLLQPLLQAQLVRQQTPSPQQETVASLLSTSGERQMGELSLPGVSEALIRQIRQAHMQSAPPLLNNTGTSSERSVGESPLSRLREQLMQQILQSLQAPGQQIQQPRLDSMAPQLGIHSNDSGISDHSQILSLLQRAQQEDHRRRTAPQPTQALQQLLSHFRQQEQQNKVLNLDNYLSPGTQNSSSSLNLPRYSSAAGPVSALSQGSHLLDQQHAASKRLESASLSLRTANLNSKTEDSSARRQSLSLQQQALGSFPLMASPSTGLSRLQQLQLLLQQELEKSSP